MESHYHQFHRALAGPESFQNSPRFGYSKQFSDLFSEDGNTKNDYSRGISAVGIILLAFFLLWTLVLCFCKCCLGKRRVGYLSGAPYDARTTEGKPNRRAVRGRLIFGFSGVMFVVFTLLLVLLGFANLIDTTNELSNGAEASHEIFVDAENIVDDFLKRANQTAQLRDTIVNQLERAFEIGANGLDAPAASSNNTLSSNATTSGASTETNANAAKFIYDGINLQERVAPVLVELNDLGSFIQEPAAEVNDTLNDGENKTETLKETLAQVELKTLQMRVGVPLLVVGGLMILIMLFSSLGISNSYTVCFTAWILTPLFLLIVVVLCLWTAGMSVGGNVNADFCSGGQEKTPEATLLNIMENKGIQQDSFKYREVDYVIHGCNFDNPGSEMPLHFITNFSGRVNSTLDDISSLMVVFDNIGLSVLSDDLGYNATDMQRELQNFEADGLAMVSNLTSLLVKLSCDRIYEIYAKVIDDATCNGPYSGVVWTFSSLLVISFFGFVMVTYRAALYPLAGIREHDYVDDYSWNDTKEKEMEMAAASNGTGAVREPEEVSPDYKEDEGQTAPANEIPMGAQQQYDTVGDDNPFADVSSGQDAAHGPKKSAWE